MADWTADDLLAGKPQVDHDEQLRRRREAMADPESVTMVIKGRNGETVECRILAHERTHLSVTCSYDQEECPEYGYFTPMRTGLWVPRWKRFTWSIEQQIDYRAEDFLATRRATTP